MSKPAYLIFHRDHALDPAGIHSGAEMATLFLSRFLAKRGFKVVLCAQLVGGETEKDGVQFWDLGATFDVAAALERARALGSYHLLSAGLAVPLLLSQKEKGCLSRCLISHDRAGGDSGIDAKILSRIVDCIFCVSNAQKDVFVKAGLDPAKVVVIHNGVDLDIFQPGDVETRNLRKIVFVGALVVDKGLHVLLQSYAKLKQKYSDLTIDVYGSSSLWYREEYINPSDIEKQLPGVKFHGKVPQTKIAEAFRTAGLCVVPSIWFDPFPLVSIDAQACGCPVVAFDVGGLKEGIQDKATGIVVKEISEDALTRALDDLLSNKDKLKEFSRNALQLSRPRFTWEKLIETVTSNCEKAAASRSFKTPKIGLISTWNQECGLAAYARNLFSELPKGSYVVLSEETSDKKTAADEPFVKRCWSKTGVDFADLSKIIVEERIEVLFFNVHTHYRFWPQPATSEFFRALKSKGIKIVAHLHNTYTIDKQLQTFLSEVDRVVVLSPENRLEAIANGASPDAVSVIPNGIKVKTISATEKTKIRTKLGVPAGENLLVCFGFIQPHKGMEGLLEAVYYLNGRGIPTRGIIAGNPAPSDPNSQEYAKQLQSIASQHGIADRVQFLNRFISEEEVNEYLSAADLVLMNYRSQHYEASAACAQALGAGAIVATSIAPAFQPFSDAVWHLSSGYPAAVSMEILLTNEKLRNEIKEKAKKHCETYQWPNIAITLQQILQQTMCKKQITQFKENEVVKAQSTGSKKLPTKGAGLKVLMQNRPNANQQKGGDTFIMEKTKAGLEKLGVKVTVDLEAKEDAGNYDIVHLFNFVLPDMVKFYGERALAAKKPFVVTSMYEDIPMFHNQSVGVARTLIEYVRNGQNKEWFEANKIDITRIPSSNKFDNTWTSTHASAIYASGNREADTLRRDYKDCTRIDVMPVAYDIGAEGNAEDFIREYGVKDFILCVGRLESRKNQLMLLKALEDSEIPVVLAGGGFTYQPDYEDAVRKFKRKGKTLLLGRITPHMLASAYKAARIHALPSWYELPGIVSLEAAYYGCNIVVTDAGTARDYFGDKAFYCESWSESSILQAVLAAYNSPLKEGLKEVAMKNTWDSVAERVLDSYGSIVEPQAQATSEATQTPLQVYDLDSGITDFQEILEQGELAAKARDFAAAHELLANAERINAQSVRLMRARGAVFLAEGNVDRARDYFERGLQLDPAHSRMYSGLGMCEMQSKQPEKAYDNFVKALYIAPHELVAILQLLECSYTLNRFDDLERVLRRYLLDHPTDKEMQYCLAGCLYKQGRFDEAETMANNILAEDAQHLGSKQLISAIADERAKLESAKVKEEKPVEKVVEKQVTAEESATNAAPQFDSLDIRISEIEEMKREKNYAEVLKGCAEVSHFHNLREDQKEKIALLQAEVEVLEGDIEKADAQYDAILAKNPKAARALCGKGAITAHRKSWDKAEEYFKEAHSINENYDVALAGLGLCAYASKDYDKAWEYFIKAVENNPENVRALFGVIELGYPLKRLPQVEHALRIYLEMHPVDFEFVYALAGCYFAQDKFAEASAELDKICLFQPDHKNANELRAIVNEKVGGSRVSNV